MKKIDNIKFTFGMEDYVKASNKASREISLGNGFVSTHKVFKNKKVYDRKRDKKVF